MACPVSASAMTTARTPRLQEPMIGDARTDAISVIRKLSTMHPLEAAGRERRSDNGAIPLFTTDSPSLNHHPVIEIRV